MVKAKQQLRETRLKLVRNRSLESFWASKHEKMSRKRADGTSSLLKYSKGYKAAAKKCKWLSKASTKQLLLFKGRLKTWNA